MFSIIYNQALTAEKYKLDEIAGVGYGKALEFLIKDYVKSNHSGKEAVIEKQSLGDVINNYLRDDRLQPVQK